MTRSDIPPPRPGPHGRTIVLEQLRDRWADPRLRVGALLVVAALAGFVWYQTGRSEASALAAPQGSRLSTRPAAHPVTTTVPPVLVHVAGAVVRPGLVRVATGARVADAIAAVGGAVPEADLDRLNLAAKVTDGQRILVVPRGSPGVAGDASHLRSSGLHGAVRVVSHPSRPLVDA